MKNRECKHQCLKENCTGNLRKAHGKKDISAEVNYVVHGAGFTNITVCNDQFCSSTKIAQMCCSPTINRGPKCRETHLH